MYSNLLVNKVERFFRTISKGKNQQHGMIARKTKWDAGRYRNGCCFWLQTAVWHSGTARPLWASQMLLLAPNCCVTLRDCSPSLSVTDAASGSKLLCDAQGLLTLSERHRSFLFYNHSLLENDLHGSTSKGTRFSSKYLPSANIL